jgi:hypothetical protein
VLLRHGRLDLLGAAAPALIEAGLDLRQTAEGVIARRSLRPRRSGPGRRRR